VVISYRAASTPALGLVIPAFAADARYPYPRSATAGRRGRICRATSEEMLGPRTTMVS